MKTTGAPVRIILVDDSTAVRERVAALLSAIEGVEVVGQAPDVSTGKALVQNLRPDVLVLDIGLPGESGIELLKAVRQETHPLLVIMFTNYSHREYRRACAEAGADYFFDKSLECEGLLETLRKLVAASELWRGQVGDESGTAGGGVSS